MSATRTARTASRKSPKQARSQVTVDAMLDAAAQLLVRVGYAKATTNRIAQAAGVSIGSVYQYFPTKDAVIAGIVERHIDRMRATLLRRLSEVGDAPLADLVRAMIRGLFEAHAVQPELHRVILEQIPLVDRRHRLAALEDEMRGLVEQELSRRAGELRRTRVDLAAVASVHSVTATAHAALFDERLRARSGELMEELCDMILRYLMA